MIYFARIVILTAMILAALPQASALQDRWYKVIDRDAGFTIAFPAKPIYEQSDDPTLIHQTEKYKFYYNGRRLQIIFAPLTRQPRTSTDVSDAFAEITRVQAKDGRLLSQVKLSDGGRQYDNVTRDEGGMAYHRTRVYIHNGRYYALSYSMYATDGIDEQEAERFFSSFRFTDNTSANRGAVRRGASRSTNNAQRNTWYTFRSPDGDFIVDFPDKPEFKEWPNPSTGSSDYKYYFHFGENTFIVSFREEPVATTQPKQVMQQALAKALENNNIWRVQQHVQMRDGGQYVESQGVVDGIPVFMRTKLYLRGTRLYHVSTMTRRLSGPNKDDVSRFLSSFRLL